MRRDRMILLGIVGVAVLARFATLDLQSYDHDEAVTALRVIQPNLFDTLHFVSQSERSPPLYYVLAWLWAKPFGTGEVGLRSLSALIGTLTVLAAYWSARGFGSRRTWLVAAALVAFNPYLIWYSQEARSYALMVLLVVLSIGCLVRCLREPTPRRFALWALVASLAVLSHYFAAFVVVPEALWLLLRSGRRRQAGLAVAALVAVGLALIPLAVGQEKSVTANRFTEIPLASRAGETLLNFVASEEPSPFAGRTSVDLVQAGAAVGGALLLALAVVLLIARGSEDERRAGALTGALAAAAIGVPLLLALAGVDYLNPRNLIAALGPLLLLAAAGFGARGAGRLGIAAAASACVLFGLVNVAADVSAQMQRPDYRAAAQALGPTTGPRVIVTLLNGYEPIDYYLGDVDTFHGRRYRAGVRVREIDALSTNYLVKTPPGFRLVSRQKAGGIFIVWRFVSTRPRLVTPAEVAGRRVLSERSIALAAGLTSVRGAASSG